ncbi:MAG: methyltransferase domain-containing protein, partial [Patescibacteria group bacterium]|nr:methyltransferase domain-containing protein [Patescibacteria group bacterium]
DLGRTPPANAYLRQEDLGKPEPQFPLAIYFCRSCTLVQLLDVVDPDILFKGYHFLTGASTPSVEHFEQYAKEAVKPFLDSKDDLVIDIGGNDGVLLGYLKDDARVLNVDPADNLAKFSEEKGVPFYPAFFSSAVAAELVEKYGQAKVVTANNVFAHVDPLRDVFKGVAELIGEDGVFIFEVHWVKHLVETGCFDQIYHEHLCFHSLHALKRLVELSGMQVFDVDIVPMQGQSLRVFAAKHRPATQNVARVLAEEEAAGLTTEDAYHAFAATVEKNKKTLLELLRSLKAEGKRIVGYGAPAKSTTLLHYYGLGTETLEYLTDTTPLKQGLYSPGKHIPIVPPERLLEDTPDYILLLAWNFKDAILKKEQPLRDKGVKFIITIPAIEVV